MHYLVESYLLLIECHTAAETLWQNNRTIICFPSFHWRRARRGQLRLCVSLRLNESGWTQYAQLWWMIHIYSMYVSTLWCTRLHVSCMHGYTLPRGNLILGISTFWPLHLLPRTDNDKGGKTVQYRLTCLNMKKCITRVLPFSLSSHPNAFIHADSHLFIIWNNFTIRQQAEQKFPESHFNKALTIKTILTTWELISCRLHHLARVGKKRMWTYSFFLMQW